MPELTVKIDQVALLREARKRQDPEPAAAAMLAELAGADRIAVHLYRRHRHIQERDVRILRHTVQTGLVLEMGLSTEMIGMAMALKPDRVILVAEAQETPAAGNSLDLLLRKDAVDEAVETLNGGGISVCLCIDPDPEQIKMAHRSHAAMIQFHTGAFCAAKTTLKRNHAYMKLLDAVNLGRKLKLGIGLGHGLGYQTVRAFKNLHQIDEFCIGHSIVARAVLVGMERAVREMIARIGSG